MDGTACTNSGANGTLGANPISATGDFAFNMGPIPVLAGTTKTPTLTLGRVEDTQIDLFEFERSA